MVKPVTGALPTNLVDPTANQRGASVSPDDRSRREVARAGLLARLKPCGEKRTPRLDCLVVEEHARVAEYLEGRDLVVLSDVSRELRNQYANHVTWARLQHQVTKVDRDRPPPMFEIQYRDTLFAKSDEEIICERLREYLDPPSSKPATVRNMPPDMKAATLISTVRGARRTSYRDERDEFRETVLQLVEPRIKELPRKLREHVICEIALQVHQNAQGRFDVHWCLDMIEADADRDAKYSYALNELSAVAGNVFRGDDDNLQQVRTRIAKLSVAP